MKTTIEIADDLFEHVQRVAKKEKITFRSFIEQGLRLVLKERESKSAKLTPLITVPDEFKSCGWKRIRDEIHR